jgi:hypothetical protein
LRKFTVDRVRPELKHNTRTVFAELDPLAVDARDFDERFAVTSLVPNPSFLKLHPCEYAFTSKKLILPYPPPT